MRYLYYCNSTYQILNALNLNWHRKYDGFENISNYQSDLIILDVFNGAKNIAIEIEKNNDFDNVYVVHRTDSKSFHILHTIASVLFPSSVIKRSGIVRYDKLKNIYDVITVPKFSTFTAALWQINKKAQLHYYEDGLATYSGNIITKLKSSRLYSFLFELRNPDNPFDNYKKIYVNKASIFTGKEDVNIVEIPCFNKKYFAHIKDYFVKPNTSNFNKKMYWLYQFNFLSTNEYKELREKTAELLAPYVDDILFFPHPRVQDFNVEKMAEADTLTPWEIKSVYIDDLDSKYLLSTSTTAVFTPKILFNKEPHIILTYKLLGESQTEFIKNIDNFVTKFKELYSEDRLFIPNTYDELKNYLEGIFNSGKK